jgi:hypothetical protein
MTPEQIEQERAAFEAWHKETFGYLPKKYNTGTFMSPSRADEVNPQDMFDGWLARAKQTDWISVEDRLPEAHDDILVYTYDGDIYPITAICRDITWIGISGATHWQPLPQPPAGGAK